VRRNRFYCSFFSLPSAAISPSDYITTRLHVNIPDGCAGFNEWYVFNSPFDLGELWHDNVFEAPIPPGQVCRFVNFGPGFALHDPEMLSLVSLFWKQLDWIQPESYIADADIFLTFVSRNEDIFVAVRNALSDVALNS
jgi:hypothetical protein